MIANRTFILVHDIFQEFSKNIDRVLTLSNMKNFDILRHNVVIGQGLSLNQIIKLIDGGVTIVNSEFIFSIERKEYVHKKSKSNVIITIPKKKSCREFENFILLSHDSGILDHVTGIHIPAIALLEAARQSMLSIIERFFLPQNIAKIRFSILSSEAKFFSFVFPTQIKIISRLLDPCFKGKSINGFLESNIWQQDCLCATIVIEFSCRDEERVLNHEIFTFNQRFYRNDQLHQI
ncbi:MAG: AfsA-related hotdog domain-containing protein [Gammaproteobacteria bacterium]